MIKAIHVGARRIAPGTPMPESKGEPVLSIEFDAGRRMYIVRTRGRGGPGAPEGPLLFGSHEVTDVEQS